MQIKQSLVALTAVAAALMGSASAQSTPQDTIDTGIATVLLNMEATRLVPNLVSASQLQLHGLLVQTFGSQNVSVGQLVSVPDVANQPSWSVEYSSAANTSSMFQSNMYTVMTLDPGAASEQPRNIVRHYLANNLTLSSTTGQLMNSSKPIAGWFSPAPPAGSGVHRYATLVFQQPTNFTAELPAELQNRDPTIDTNFNLTDYIRRANLGPIVAANFFLAQNNDTAARTTVTPDVVSTTAVASSSIAAAASSVSKSLSSAYTAAPSSVSSGTNGAMALASVPSGHVLLAVLSTMAFVVMGALTL